MEDFDKIKDQMKPLLSLVKDTENTDIEVDIYLQIFSFKETERDSKKVYMMSLCDQDYKFNSFFLYFSFKFFVELIFNRLFINTKILLSFI